MAKDLMLEVLKQIRDEVKTTNKRLDVTNQRLERLEDRQNETETRLATELIAVASAVNELRDAFVQDRELRKTVESHDKRIAALELRSH